MPRPGYPYFEIHLKKWNGCYEVFCMPFKAWDFYRYFYETICKSRVLLMCTAGMDCFYQFCNEPKLPFARMKYFEAPYIFVNDEAVVFDGKDFANIFFSRGNDLYPDIFSFLIFKRQGNLQSVVKNKYFMNSLEKLVKIAIKDNSKIEGADDFHGNYDVLRTDPFNNLDVELFACSHDDCFCTLWMKTMSDVMKFTGRYLYEFLANDFKRTNVFQSYPNKQCKHLYEKIIIDFDDDILKILLEHAFEYGICCFPEEMEASKKGLSLKIWKNRENEGPFTVETVRQNSDFFVLKYSFKNQKWSMSDIRKGKAPRKTGF